MTRAVVGETCSVSRMNMYGQRDSMGMLTLRRMSFFSKDTRENTLNGNARSESKVFVIGYSRTGTSSTTEALRMLGYKSVHYPLSVITLEGDSVALVPERVEPFDAL